ncbi:MAG: hypothetical protein EXR76_07900 [Myxococcales bacterium]|nr:hypothetical protein [Myxococcales bacterium]
MRLFDTLYLAPSTTLPSVSTTQPVEMGDNNALSISVTLIVGSSASTVDFEGSNDLTNWSTQGITNSLENLGAAPSFTAGNVTTVAYVFARAEVLPRTPGVPTHPPIHDRCKCMCGGRMRRAALLGVG